MTVILYMTKIGKLPSEATDGSKNKKNKSSKFSELRCLFQNSLQDKIIVSSLIVTGYNIRF